MLSEKADGKMAKAGLMPKPTPQQQGKTMNTKAYKQAADLDGPEYILDQFADERADELLPGYWREYMQTGRVSDFDIDSYSLEAAALASGVSDFKTHLREHIRREIKIAARDRSLSREWRNAILGPCTIWS